MDYKFVLHTQRNELMRKLQKSTVPLFSSGIFSIYEHVKKTNKVKKYLLKEFQKSLVDISVWSKELLRNEYTRFEKTFPLFNKLVAKIFDIQMGMHGKNTVPIDSVDFLHQCYLNIARSIWKQPFLVYDVGVDKLVVQKNKLKVEKIIGDCIKDTFDHFLPFDDDVDSGQEAQHVDVKVERNAEDNNISLKQWEEETVVHQEEQQVQDEQPHQDEEVDDLEDNLRDNLREDFEDGLGDGLENNLEDNLGMECASNSSANDAHHEVESSNDEFQEQYSLEEESEDLDYDNNDVVSDEDSTDLDEDEAASETENVIIQPVSQYIPHIPQHTHDAEVAPDRPDTQDTQDTQDTKVAPDVQDLSVAKLDENNNSNAHDKNNQTHELTEQNLKTINLLPSNTTHVSPSTSAITPKDNIKIVTYDDKAGKVKSLLSLKKKVKSSMLNAHIQTPSFF